MTPSPSALTIAFLGAFLLSACSQDTPQSNAPTASPARPTTTAPAQGATAPAATTNVMLNPPHGEPGHVCEIPVGEPLDGSGGGNGATQTIPMGAGQGTAISTPQVQGMQGGGSGALNPAHGEPGHVCEIPVGQPLP